MGDPTSVPTLDPTPLPSVTATATRYTSYGLEKRGKKCSNVASSANAGVNHFGHCEAGNGGGFPECLRCVTQNPACEAGIVNFQPDGQGYCKCVAAGDTCSETASDSNYEVWMASNFLDGPLRRFS